MDIQISNTYINSIVVILLVIFIIAILLLFSNKKKTNKCNARALSCSCLSLLLLFLLGVYNELVLYWFNDASDTILSSFEMVVKIAYDSISVGIIILAFIFIYHLLKFFRRTMKPFHLNTFKYMRCMAITANFTVILLVIRTVCIPLFLELCRFFNFFSQGSVVNTPQDIFLYAVPYLGLEEIVIILVTIMINMIGFVYYETVDNEVKKNDLAR